MKFFLLQNLKNKYIVQLHDYYVENDKIYILMEYLDKTLENLIDDKNLFPKSSNFKILNEHIKCIAGIIKDILFGIYKIHNSGIIHRDIKPENIGIKYDLNQNGKKPRAVIIDFGESSKINIHQINIHKKKKKISPTFKRQTSISEIKDNSLQPHGTPIYMAPEMYNLDSKYDEKIDIYSLGLSIFGLLSGKKTNEYWTQIDGIHINNKLNSNKNGNNNKLLEIIYDDLENKFVMNKEEIDKMYNKYGFSGIFFKKFIEDCLIISEKRLSADELLIKYFSPGYNNKYTFINRFKNSYIFLGDTCNSQFCCNDNYKKKSNIKKESENLCHEVRGCKKNKRNSKKCNLDTEYKWTNNDIKNWEKYSAENINTLKKEKKEIENCIKEIKYNEKKKCKLLKIDYKKNEEIEKKYNDDLKKLKSKMDKIEDNKIQSHVNTDVFNPPMSYNSALDLLAPPEESVSIAYNSALDLLAPPEE